MKREQDGNLIDIKIPRFFVFFIHLSTKEKLGRVVDTTWSKALLVNVALTSENCSEKLNSNMNINICFHTLQVSRYAQTHVDLALPSIHYGFWMFSLEIPKNKGLPY